jgi:hypothetical protein
MATLYFNDACYVGSNTAARFSEAINKCEDLPDAAISRLAWIESEELLEYLREVLVVRKGQGKQAVPDFDSVVLLCLFCDFSQLQRRGRVSIQYRPIPVFMAN